MKGTIPDLSNQILRLEFKVISQNIKRKKKL